MASQSSGGTAHPSELVSDQVSGAFKKGRQSSSPDDRSDFQTNTPNSGKLPHTVKYNLPSEMCEHLSTYDLNKLIQQLHEAGIETSGTGEHIQVNYNTKETDTVELILNTWKHRMHNGPVYIRDISPDLHQMLLCSFPSNMRYTNNLLIYFKQNKELEITGDVDFVNKVKQAIDRMIDYQCAVIGLSEEQLKTIEKSKKKFIGENKDVILRIDSYKLYLYCSHDEMTEMVHKLRTYLGIVKINSTGRQKQEKDVSAVAACNDPYSEPLIKTPHTLALPATVMTPKLCMTFKVGRKWRSKVYKGSILGVNVDCIVNVNQEGSISEIVRAGGREVERELQEVSRSQKLEPTTCVISNPDFLKFKKILHVGELKWGGYLKEQKCREDIFNALHNCLMVADRNNMSSIGIPALSSEEFGIPFDICAEEYCRALRENEEISNCLEEIHLVFMLDDYVEQVLKIFLQAFTVEQSDTDSELQQLSLVHVDAATRKQTHYDAGVSISEQEDDIFEGQHRENISFCFIEPGIFDVRGIEVKVYSGDILKLAVACIVNGANEKLEHGGGVARVISKAAGKNFQQESHEFIKCHGRLKVSECVYTSGCDLKYEYVLHAVGPRWRSTSEETRTRKELRDTIINSLRCVEQLNLPSVGIPPISAGIFGVPKKVCAEEYGNGIVEFIERYNPKVLQEIHFVDVAPDLVRIICDTFQRFSTGKPPIAVHRQPVAIDRQPSAADRQPGAADRRPVAADRPPVLECENPVFNQQSQQNRTSSNTQKHALEFINNEFKPQSPSDIESRQEQTSSNTAIQTDYFLNGSKKSMSSSFSGHLKSYDGTCSSKSLMDSYNSLPLASLRSSNRHTGGTGNMQQSPTDKDSEPGSRACNYSGLTTSRGNTGGAGAMQQSPTFNEPRPEALEWNNPGQTTSRGHTGGAGAMQQSPTFNESWAQQTFGKKSMKTGCRSYMSMSYYDCNKRHETDNDRRSLSRSQTDGSPTSLQPSMDRRADCKKDVTGKRTMTTEDVKRKTINDEASQMNIAETLGTWKSPYEFDLDPQNEGSVKVLVYKHDITLCTVDAIVSVWTPPGSQQGSIAAAIERQVGTCPVTSITDLENSIKYVPKDLKTNFKSVIYANTPRFKNEDRFKRELERCIQNIFRTATNDRHRIRSIALPVLGLGPGSTPETCCDILVEETFKACNVSRHNLGSLCKIHLIGFDEGIVYVLKDLAEQKLKCLAKKENQRGEWSTAVKKGSHK